MTLLWKMTRTIPEYLLVQVGTCCVWSVGAREKVSKAGYEERERERERRRDWYFYYRERK